MGLSVSDAIRLLIDARGGGAKAALRRPRAEPRHPQGDGRTG